MFSLLIILCILTNALGIGEVIWAVNCGGESHTDVHGIRYQADPLQDVGFASDYGKNLLIQRVVPQDQILYQTERYHLSTFTYDIPVWKDGDYVLVMKFSEVWFTSANQKVTACTLFCLSSGRMGHSYCKLLAKKVSSSQSHADCASRCLLSTRFLHLHHMIQSVVAWS